MLSTGLKVCFTQTLDDLKNMDWNSCNNKEKWPFSNLQGDDFGEAKFPIIHTMKRNLRRSKAYAFRKAMKKKTSFCWTMRDSSRIWKPKSKVMIPNKKLNQDTGGFIHFSYKKRHSIIYDAKCGPYINVPKIKHRSHTHVFESKCRPQARVHDPDVDLTSMSQMINADLKFPSQKINVDHRPTCLQKLLKIKT